MIYFIITFTFVNYYLLQDLKNRFSCVRKVRGDGNCFYRAFGFRYFETLVEDKTDFKRQDAVQCATDKILKISPYLERLVKNLSLFGKMVLSLIGKIGKKIFPYLEECFFFH